MNAFFRLFAAVLALLAISNLLALCLFYFVRLLSNSSLIADEFTLISLVISIGIFLFLQASPFRRISLKISNIYFKRKIDLFDSIMMSTLVFFSILMISLQPILNIDRSRSLFIFNWVHCRPEGMTIAQLSDKIESELGMESREAFEQRYAEHQLRGLITARGELSRSGLAIYQLAISNASLFNLEGWSKNSLWKDDNC